MTPRISDVAFCHGPRCKCGAIRPDSFLEARIELGGFHVDVVLTYAGRLRLPAGVALAPADVRAVEDALRAAAIEALQQRFGKRAGE
jgi:hypothetical protein